MRLSGSLIAASALISITQAAKVLVITDKNVQKSQYSQFWTWIEDGHQVTYRSTGDKEPALAVNNIPSFDNIVIIAPSAKTLSEDLSPQRLVQHLKDGGNMLVAVDDTVSEMWRDFGREFGLDFEPSGTTVRSFFNAAGDSVFAVDPEILEPIIYRGIAHSSSSSPLLQSFLTASNTAFSFDATMEAESIADSEEAGETVLKGTEAKLVRTMQTLNNARVSWTGSTEMFKDAIIDDTRKNGNAKFMQKLIKWTFKQDKVVEIVFSQHFKEGDASEEQRDVYTIRDNITFRVQLVSPDQNDRSKVEPFTTSDLQVELSLLEPYVRVQVPPTKLVVLSNEKGKAQEYEVTIKAPDQHGVFWIGVDWRRAGYTTIAQRHRLSIVPPRHNEYPRFITAAYPYYVSAFSSSIGFLIFCYVWLSGRAGPIPASSSKTKKIE